MKLTLVVTEGQDGFLIGRIQELPPVMTQGKNLKEVKKNILDALSLYIDYMRDELKKSTEKIIAKEEIIFS